MLSYQQQFNMLSNNYYNKLVDICCRVVSTDGEVTLEERIWMTKLKENNRHAEKVVKGFGIT